MPPGTGILLHLCGGPRRTRGGPGCEVAPCPAVAPLPGVAPWLLGIVVHKGEALPLVDLARALEDTGRATSVEHGRMLVSRAGGVGIAFLVDDVDADDGRPGAVPLDLEETARALLARGVEPG